MGYYTIRYVFFSRGLLKKSGISATIWNDYNKGDLCIYDQIRRIPDEFVGKFLFSNGDLLCIIKAEIKAKRGEANGKDRMCGIRRFFY
jgi:hypothetical protein